jgi:thiamine-phosphate pyrophosphorylase
VLRYAIIDRSYSPANAHRWSALGVDFVQLRDKSLPAGDLAKLARTILKDLVQFPNPPRLLINGRVDVAIAVGAAGVHLTAHPDELTPDQVRSIFALAGKPAPLISISCHTLDEVKHAHAAKVDLILFGPVFEKRVGGQLVTAGLGLQTFQAACEAAGETPVLALGGVTEGLVNDCLRAGAKGIAAIRLFA